MEVSGQIHGPAALPQETDRIRKRVRRGAALNLAGLGILEDRQYLGPAGIRSPTRPVHIMVPTATTLPRSLSLRRRALKWRSQRTKTQTNIINILLRHERRERWR